MFKAILVLVFVSLVVEGAHIESIEPEVIDLTNADVWEAISEGKWFVKFYAPWCGHCKRLAPIWNELPAALEGSDVHVADIDATVNKAAGQKFEIRGFPTLMFISNGKLHKYSGARTLEDLKAFALAEHDDDDGISLPRRPNALDRLASRMNEWGEPINRFLSQNGLVATTVAFLVGSIVGGGLVGMVRYDFAKERMYHHKMAEEKRKVEESQKKKKKEAVGKEE